MSTVRIRVIGDPLALIGDREVDAVVIASHDATHADLTVAAVRAGKPVLCEKPLAPTEAECVRVVREERAAGRRLISLGFMRRFDPGYRELKEAIASGVCGAPLRSHCVSHRRSLSPTRQASTARPPRSCAPWTAAKASSTTLFSDTPTTATVAGTQATLSLPGPFYQPGEVLLTRRAAACHCPTTDRAPDTTLCTSRRRRWPGASPRDSSRLRSGRWRSRCPRSG